MALGFSLVIASPVPPPHKAAALHKPANVVKTQPAATPVTPQPPAVTQPETPPVGTTAPVEQIAPVVPATPTGGKYDWMAQAGIASSDYAAADYIVTHESGWRYWAVNSIGATGLCQSLPGDKMASAGADYMTNPATQLRWCNSYAAKYGGWWGSYNFWVSHSWW